MSALTASVVRWRVALRIARRGARRTLGRSVLIVLLIALPMAGIAGTALVTTSATATPEEWLDYQLGHAATQLAVVSGPDKDLQQDPVRPLPYGYVGDSSSTGERSPRAFLPAGTRMLQIGSSEATVRGRGEAIRVAVVSGPSWDPALAGRYDLTAGRAPRATGEITLSKTAADALDVTIGDQLQQSDPTDRTLQVVGIEQDRQADAAQPTLFGSEEDFPSTAARGALDGYNFYLPDLALTWKQIQGLNTHGIVALSRTVALDPPATPSRVQSNTVSWTDDLGGFALQAGGFLFALLEVGVLAAAAFAVGTRTQQRLLAGLAAAGADPAVLRRITTASGIVLGVLGGVVGIAFGLAGGTGVMRILNDGGVLRSFGWHLPVVPLLAILVLAIAAGWAAAVVPARAAARIDVVSALRGARRPTLKRLGRRRWVPVLTGLAAVTALALGTVLLLARPRAAGDISHVTLLGLAAVAGGVISLLATLILAAGPLLQLAVKPLAHARLGARLAGRDIARNRSRTVPAMVVVTLTTLLATFLLTAANSETHTLDLTYNYSAQPGQLITTPIQQVRFKTSAAERKQGAPDYILGSSSTQSAATAYRQIIRRELSIDRIAQLAEPRTMQDFGFDTDAAASTRSRDALPRLVAATATQCPSTRLPNDDPACGRNSTTRTDRQVRIATPAQVELVTGIALTDSQRQLLEHGGAIATKTNLVADQRITLNWYTPAQYQHVGEDNTNPDDAFATVKAVRTVHLRAMQVLPTHSLAYDVFVTPATAHQLGIRSHPAELIATLRHPVTAIEASRLDNALNSYSHTSDGGLYSIQGGPGNDRTFFTWIAAALALLIALAASGTAVALAAADARADRATLHAIGAPPRIRRTIAAVEGLLATTTGVLLGVLLGLIPAAALGFASWSYSFWLPWQPLALLVLGLPTLITAASWLSTRTPKETRRRTAAA